MTYKTILEINDLINVQLSEKLQEFSLTINQWKILIKIYQSENNKITARNLSKVLRQDKRTLSLNLKFLESNNFIQRIENDNDKRQKYITLNDETLEIAEDLLSLENDIEAIIQIAIDDKSDFNTNLENISKQFKEL